MKGLTIGALARAAGVKVETIRFYERKGLLRRPAKPETGYRRYPPEDVDRVKFIKKAQGMGFTLREVGEMLRLEYDSELSCAEMSVLADGKIAEMDGKIRTLEAMRHALAEMVRQCPREGSLSLCPIWHRLEQREEEVSIMEGRKVEVFTAGCPVCADLVEMVKAAVCPHCQLTIYHLNQGQGVEEAKKYGVTAVPAVAVDGKLLECCQRRAITPEDLKAAGLGQPK